MWHGDVVLLAGGIASRMQPLSRYLPKSMLPLRDRPLIVHYLEKFELLGVQRVTVVLEPMFGSMIELALNRGYRGRMWIKFLYQDRTEGRGPGYALSLCRGFVNAPVVVFLPDEWRPNERFSYSVIYEPDGYRHFDAAVAVAPFAHAELTSIGNVQIGDDDKIVRYLNKPAPESIISKWGTSGGWAFFSTDKLFEQLEGLKVEPKYAGVELHMAVVVESMIKDGLAVRAFKEAVGPQIHFTDIAHFWGASRIEIERTE